MREGLTDLAAELRRMVNDTAGTVWVDSEIQQYLDSNARAYRRWELTPAAGPAGTAMAWSLGRTHVEGTASGTPYWRLEDSTWDDVAGTAYELNASAGIVTWLGAATAAPDTLRADFRAYDLHAAAASMWQEAAAGKVDLFAFHADGALFSRGQWFDHCLAMAAEHRKQALSKTTRLIRTDALW